MITIWSRCDNVLLTSSVRCSEENFRMLGHKILSLCICVWKSQTFLRAHFMFASTSSAQRPSCSYDSAFRLRTCCPQFCLFPYVWLSSLVPEQNVAQRLIVLFFKNCLSNLQYHGFHRYCCYTMQKVSLRLESNEEISSVPDILATATIFFRFVRLQLFRHA